MNKEIWKDITGYEGLYQVSDQGRVKSLERKDCLGRIVKERILKSTPTNNGYLLVALCDGGKPKTLTVHRLVCQAFHKNPEDKPEVNHIDEDKTNNNAVNLEWCTREENINHGSRNERAGKSGSKPVAQYSLDGELIKIWPSLTEVERQTGFCNSAISEAANGKRKQAYNFVWKYVKEV